MLTCRFWMRSGSSVSVDTTQDSSSRMNAGGYVRTASSESGHSGGGAWAWAGDVITVDTATRSAMKAPMSTVFFNDNVIG
jgi:hypothetical protein